MEKLLAIMFSFILLFDNLGYSSLNSFQFYQNRKIDVEGLKLICVKDVEIDKTLYVISDFILTKNPKLSFWKVYSLANSFIQASKDFNVPLSILLAVAWQESHFKSNAISKSGCIGIMQVNYDVWKEKLNIPYVMLFHDDVNIRAGAFILNYYYQKYHNWNTVLYRYYGISDFGRKYKRYVMFKKRIVENKLEI